MKQWIIAMALWATCIMFSRLHPKVNCNYNGMLEGNMQTPYHPAYLPFHLPTCTVALCAKFHNIPATVHGSYFHMSLCPEGT